MDRVELINRLINENGYKTYLEIGVSNPAECYYKIIVDSRESCDPYYNLPEDYREFTKHFIECNLTYHCTSDDMFVNMPSDKKYDIIFIDGMHLADYTLRDIENSLRHLNPGGKIIVHDCLPDEEITQTTDLDNLPTMWTGDVWKAIYSLYNTGIKYHTIDMDWGCCVIEYTPNVPRLELVDNLTWEDYVQNKEQRLNIVSIDGYFTHKNTDALVAKEHFMPTRLVFHLYYDKKMGFNEAYLMHFNCLKEYKNCFDEVVVVIAIDDISDAETIRMLEKKVIDVGFIGKTTFSVKQNDDFGEASTFYEEIGSKIGNFNGWTFFSHTKGVTNIYNQIGDKDSILNWIAMAYYFGLGRPDIKNDIIKNQPLLSYGFPMEKNNKKSFVYDGDWFYPGTMFWLNEPGIKRFMMKNNIPNPLFVNRWYAESYLANIFPATDEIYQHYNAGSPGYLQTIDSDFYTRSQDVVPFLFGERFANRPDIIEDYKLFFRRMTKGSL